MTRRTISAALGYLQQPWVWLVLMVAAMTSSSIAARDEAAETFNIAIVGPMSGEDSEKGEAMVAGAMLYFEKVNAAGGIHGRQIEVDVLDDRNQAASAREQAGKVAAESRALAVIGHRSSSASRAAGGVYADAGIPAITATATAPEVTRRNDWYFRVVFNNAQQGAFIAQYIRKVLGHGSAAIVYDENDYGSSLAASFRATARKIGLDIPFAASFETGSPGLGQRLARIVDDLSADAPEALFLAVNDEEGARLACLVRDCGLDVRLVGGNSIGKQSFASSYACAPGQAGGGEHYSDQVYATSALIFDVANERAQRFRLQFIDRYGREPDAAAAGYFDAAALIVEAIRETGANRSRLEDGRIAIRDYLKGMAGFESAFHGVTGDIYFTPDGDAVKAVPVGIYSHQKLVSAPLQLQPVLDVARIADLDDRLGRGEVLKIGDDYMLKTNIAYAGIDINKIEKIDSATSTYLVDFFLWLRNSDDIDAVDIEFTNAVEPVELGEPIAEHSYEGMSYRAFRVRSSFWGDFEFGRYPFDSQVLSVRFRHRHMTREDLIYVIDEIGMRRSGADASADSAAADGLLEPGSEWRLHRTLFFQDTLTNQSTLGDPRFLDRPKGFSYSRFNAHVEVSRDAFRYVVKKMLFILVLAGVLYLTFFLPPDYIDARLAIGIGGLVIIPFLRLELVGELSGVGYLVAADYIYFLLYLLALAVILLCIASMNEIHRGNEARAKRLDLIGRAGYPVLLLAGVGALGMAFRT